MNHNNNQIIEILLNKLNGDKSTIKIKNNIWLCAMYLKAYASVLW
jgi:hypothetical protein